MMQVTRRCFLSILVGVAAAGCGPERGGTDGCYVVNFAVKGLPAAFEGRTIEIQGIKAPTATDSDAFIYQPSDAKPRLFATGVQLFVMNDVAAFKDRKVHVVVREAGRVVADQLVERIGCHYGFRAGETFEEDNQVTLAADGSVDAAFGDSPGAESDCVFTGDQFVCPATDTL